MSELYPLKLFGLHLFILAALATAGFMFQPNEHVYCAQQSRNTCFKFSIGEDYQELSRHEIEKVAAVVARFFNVPERLVLAVIAVESNFDTRATSPVGAKGLMQINDITATELGLRDAYHPIENIIAGVRYLSLLNDRFDGNLDLTLAAYNAGPTLVSRLGAVPDYSETKNYIEKVKTKL